MRTVGVVAALIDWDLASSTGVRLVRGGPEVAPDTARAAVLELRSAAVEARTHVRAFTGLDAPAADAPVEVVDRPTWLRANIDGFRALLEPVEGHLLKGRDPSSVVTTVGSSVTAVELGGVLAWLSGKVLGQFEVFATGEDRPGRLLLVAPNVVSVERELGVDPHDFRLWVCLHEETHRVQFGAVPWLRGHLVTEIQGLLKSIDSSPGALSRRVRDVLEGVYASLRGGRVPALAELVQTPEQKIVVERLTAVMSLLEGHADVVMDGVGPEVVPSVEHIRKRFQQRRRNPSRIDGVLRTLLGLDAKLRQYTEGAVFVRGVVEQVGMEGFNRVWSGPETLPNAQELHDPAAWVARVNP